MAPLRDAEIDLREPMTPEHEVRDGLWTRL
jgi:hypothetical protein